MVYLVQQYFSESANSYPDKVAVACKSDAQTYRETDELTNARARALRRAGVARGSFVPFFMPKGVPAINALLSVLKADCAYVPIDFSSPRDRVLSILKATSAKTVIVNRESASVFCDRLGEDLGDIELFNIDDPVPDSVEPISFDNISIDVAYVLFTSGSTGIPKGVMISHQMIIDYIDWCVDEYRLTEADRIANHAPLFFDNSTFDIYTAFKTGAELHLVHDELNLFMHKLITWIEDRGITTFFCVPSVLAILLRSGRVSAKRFPKLRHVIAAGEVLSPAVLRDWMLAVPHAQFTNMYGPTEITVDCLAHVFTEPPHADADAVPIGKPRRNMEVLLRLEDGSLTRACGATGEIVVRGKSVSYGYLNNPEKTRSAFIQNPSHSDFHDPIYLTGDLGKIDDQGSFVFLGRKDQQIKYMGNRIELGEIESILNRVPGVEEGVVVFNDAPKLEEKCIGALVCLGGAATVEEVAGSLKASLPGYMVPRKLVATAELPRTPNGKADRRAAFSVLFPSEK